MNMQIAKLLVKENIISLEQIKEAIEKQRNTHMELSEALVELGYITESEILDFLAKSYGVPVIRIEDHSIEKEVLDLIPQDIAIENRLIPLSVTGSALTVAMSDPSNLILVDKLNFLTEKNIIPVVVSERSLTSMLEQYYNYSKNYTDFSELSSEPGSKDQLDIEEMIRELEGFMSEDSSEDTPNESAEEENAPSALTEETSQLEQVNSDTGALETEAPDSNEELTSTAEQIDLDNSEEIGTEQESSFTDDSDVSGENLFINAPDLEASLDMSGDGIQKSEDNPGNIEDTNDESAELSSTLRELTSVIESSAIDKEPEIETKAKAKDPDPENTAAPAEESASDKTIADIANQNVLVIDHSRTVQKLIILALNRKGYTVSAVSDGMEALSCLNDVKPKLIFIEINLPHMDGYRLCKIIKSHGLMKQVPIIMLSGKDGLVDKVRSKMAGANGHISKPFSANELVDAAERFTSSNAQRFVSGKS